MSRQPAGKEARHVVTVRVVRVFTDHAGRHGNPLGIIENAPVTVPDRDRRQAIAAALGYSETVFIDDPDKALITIYTPLRELPFAGHPAVGAAWMIARLTGAHPEVLRMPGGDAATWTDQDGVWVRAPLAITPPWWHERLTSAEQVDALTGPINPAQEMTQVWAWQDETTGTVRARTFAGRLGIVEDEATGSASMRLAAALGRRLIIHHGHGSIVHAEPGPPGHAAIGGHVTEDDPRSL
ncbi:PhzF family phenazine biosynthesis protein [Frankia sp. Cr2]|uniref:PhzF family phenazine biosynthesis protein n=1 Tax=Frankia sp. Cr2 TaxID=3073932 RepID=UPI002AD40C66|nr:PhzF family phenazine biosynthesis protein [Frankia sp. Cr2]